MTRFTVALTAMAALLTTANTARAAECKNLQEINTVQMIPINGGLQNFVPASMNGVTKYLLFDTGSYISMVETLAAADLKLPIRIVSTSEQLVTGTPSHSVATINDFEIGRLKASHAQMFVLPMNMVQGGTFGTDFLIHYDADFDFGSDTLNLFSQDHCPGKVNYWNATDIAVLPMDTEAEQHNKIQVPAMLDGHEIKAVLDTGTTNTTLRADLAEKIFGLTLGSPDTPEAGIVNGDRSHKEYRHNFKSLAFGDIAVTNPKIAITSSKSSFPELLIGMDVMRKLHIYAAFGEQKLYVSVASAPVADARLANNRRGFLLLIEQASQKIRSNPNEAGIWNGRCYWRAEAKIDLDEALTDCDQALKLKPRDAATLDSRAFVLYQQGKYQDALTGYDAALVADPKQAASLFMRGHAKGKLGDAAGMDADIAAAKAIKPDVDNEFRPYDVDL
jgi:hypothetical protein